MKLLKQFFPQITAFAHCDIPCGIYDPAPMQIAAHTVFRMTQLLSGKGKDEDDVKREHDVARMTHTKEEHGSLLEEEIETLKNDYFKSDHYKSYPELEGLLNEAIALSAKARQGIDLNASEDLIEKVMQVSEIFYKTKSVKPIRVKSVYPTEKDFVTYSA